MYCSWTQTHSLLCSYLSCLSNHCCSQIRFYFETSWKIVENTREIKCGSSKEMCKQAELPALIHEAFFNSQHFFFFFPSKQEGFVPLAHLGSAKDSWKSNLSTSHGRAQLPQTPLWSHVMTCDMLWAALHGKWKLIHLLHFQSGGGRKWSGSDNNHTLSVFNVLFIVFTILESY